MKEREVLFEVVRDEHGALCLQVPDTDITVYMATAFWKRLIKRLEKPTEIEEFFAPGGPTKKKAKWIQILKEGVEAQNEEVEEELKKG